VIQNVPSALVHIITAVNALKIINSILMDLIFVIWINFAIQHVTHALKKIIKINVSLVYLKLVHYNIFIHQIALK